MEHTRHASIFIRINQDVDLVRSVNMEAYLVDGVSLEEEQMKIHSTEESMEMIMGEKEWGKDCNSFHIN